MPMGGGPIVERVEGAGGVARRSDPYRSRTGSGAVSSGGDVAADRVAAAATAVAKYSGTQFKTRKKPVERKRRQNKGIAARTLITLGGVSDHMHVRILAYEGRSAARHREREPAHPHRPAYIRNLSCTCKIYRQEMTKQQLRSTYLRQRQRVYV